MPDFLAEAYADARRLAADQTGMLLSTFPETCEWNEDQVQDMVVVLHREGMTMPTGRYHCEACGWDGEEPAWSELQGEGCGGVLWTLSVCPMCGEDVSQTVVLDQEDREEGTPPSC